MAWCRQRHQAIIWSNVDLPSMKSSAIPSSVIEFAHLKKIATSPGYRDGDGISIYKSS